MYYFHNCPVNFLDCDRARLDYLTIDKVLDRLPPIYSCALIFSDAGAGRLLRNLSGSCKKVTLYGVVEPG